MAEKRTWTRRRGLGCLVAVMTIATFVAAAPARAAGNRPVLVFAAASLKNALDEVIAGYTAQTGAPVTAAYAASSALARQIEQGAPAQLFISADLDWMDYLQAKGLIDAGSRRDLLGNSIVLVAPAASPQGEVAIGPGFDLGALLGDGRLAVGDVKAVPAGKYAKAALEALGSWNGVADRLAQAENVRAALALVARDEAPLGIVYRTDAASDPSVRIVGTFPADSHPPIVYPVALTADAAGDAAAAAFLTYLAGPAARSAFEKQGFARIGGTSS